MKIKIYTAQTCPFCIKAKRYLAAKNLKFEEIDVSLDVKKATELLKITNQSAVPVIVIGKNIIIGFDKEKIDEALQK